MAGNVQRGTGFLLTMRRWAYMKSGFNKYGLKIHDVMTPTPEVEEAIRRLPDHIKDERNYRIIRAAQLSLMKNVLPKEEWRTYDEDDYYLNPYLEEVKREKAERLEWAKK